MSFLYILSLTFQFISLLVITNLYRKNEDYEKNTENKLRVKNQLNFFGSTSVIFKNIKANFPCRKLQEGNFYETGCM